MIQEKAGERSVATSNEQSFAVPVDGDCQEPYFSDGDIVIFSYGAFCREGIIPGKSYFVMFDDGTATFKRVFIDDEEPQMLVLKCWNEEKYPATCRVHQDQVVRMARAIGKQAAEVEP